MPENGATTAEQVVFALRSFEVERDRFESMVARSNEISRTDLQALDHLHLHGGLTPGQLAERMMLTSGAITALADRLEELGWLTRERHPSDRRSTVLRLTSKAQSVAEEIFAPFAAEMTEAAAGLSASERDACRRFLTQAAEISERHAHLQAELGTGSR